MKIPKEQKSEKGAEGQSVLDADKDAKAVDAMLSGLTDFEVTTTDNTGTAASEEPTEPRRAHCKSGEVDPKNPHGKGGPKEAHIKKGGEGKKPTSTLHTHPTSDSEKKRRSRRYI